MAHANEPPHSIVILNAVKNDNLWGVHWPRSEKSRTSARVDFPGITAPEPAFRFSAGPAEE